MNTKRQTIWLVSMLSLMVVLSAYYLFTGDVTKLNNASEQTLQEDIRVITEERDPTDTAGSELGAGSGSDRTDAQVLEYLQTQATSGANFFAELAFQRNQTVGKKVDDLMNIIVDASRSTEEIAQANTQYDNLQTMQAKLEDLEDQLGLTYSNVIVLAEDDNYKTIVQVQERLTASQAQTIIDMMIQELGATKDTVSVQYMY